MARATLPDSKVARFAGLIFCGAILVVVGLLIFAATRNHGNSAATAQHGCAGQILSLGASGNCVQDAQTMVNFMETDGLTECPFNGSARLSQSGTYDHATEQQVKVVQQWLNCYSKQEGGGSIVHADGTITPATWTQLCNYAYRFPSQSGSSQSPYAKASIAAGKNANCSGTS